VVTVTYELPYNFTVGTVSFFASGRSFNATTGVDNNADGSVNDRPVVNGAVVGKSAFTGTGTQNASVFVEYRLKSGRQTIVLRAEGFNLLNHADLLGRGITTYGDKASADPAFGQFTSAPAGTTVAIPAFANINPPRMVQIVLRVGF